MLSLLLAAPGATDFAQRLDEIAVNRVAEIAGVKLKTAKTIDQDSASQDSASNVDDDAEPDDDDYSNALNDVARAFENAVAHSRPFSGETPPNGKGPPPGGGPWDRTSKAAESAPPNATRSRSELRRWTARQAILETAARNAPATAGLARAPVRVTAVPSGRGNIERLVLEKHRASFEKKGQITSLGEEFHDRLAEELKSVTPAKRRAFVASAKGLGNHPSGIVSPGSQLLMEIVGESIGAITDSGDVTRVLAKGIAKKLVEPVTKRIGEIMINYALARAHQARDLHKFAENTARDIESNRVLTARGAVLFAKLKARVPTDLQIWRNVKHLQPTLEASNISGSNKAGSIVETIVATTKKNSPSSNSAARYANPLATYGDFFPGRYGSETKTRRGSVLAKILGGQFKPPPDKGSSGAVGTAGSKGPRQPPGGSGPARSKAAAVHKYQRTATRARSFSRLRGFAKVGGVLIGRDPEENAGEKPDIIGFFWRFGDDGTTLRLVHRDGRDQEFGPYPPALIHNALAYAADGRPVSVTMTPAPPLADLKILLHPALIDTPIGCRVIEIDRFVDRFTDRRSKAKGPIATAERQARAQVNLYDFTVAARTKAILDELSRRRGTPNQIARAEKRIEALRQRVSASLSAAPNATTLQFAASDLTHLGDPQRSPIAAKPQLYDHNTVQEMQFCADRSSIGEFSECLSRRAAQSTQSVDDLLDLLDKAARPGPGVEYWSGVREREYTIDQDLGFLIPPDGDDGLWPFNFVLQIAFETEPVRGWAGDELQVDESPWDFPSVKDDIAGAILKNRNHLRVAPVLNDVANFTILQRLFRTVLAGRLGRDFPLGSLVELAEVTAPSYSNSVPLTPRWTPRSGRLERRFATLLKAADPPYGVSWRREFASRKQQCLDLLGAASDPSGIAEDRWNTACRFDKLAKLAKQSCDQPQSSYGICRSANLIAHFNTVANARLLRSTLNVAASEAISRNVRIVGCPPL